MTEVTGTRDWSSDVALLKRLTPMASRVHVVAAGAMLKELGTLADGTGDDEKRRILAIKLVAEAMSALEDFGALCRAVRMRDEGGIISNYRDYPPGDISKVFQEILEGSFRWNYLRLYVPMEFVDGEDAEDAENPVWSLDMIVGSTAKWQQAQGLIDVYNGAKHGFRVLAEAPEGVDTDGPDDGSVAYFLTKETEPGFVGLKRLMDWPEKAMMVIETCSVGWRQLADLVCFMHDNNYSLEPTEPPRT